MRKHSDTSASRSNRPKPQMLFRLDSDGGVVPALHQKVVTYWIPLKPDGKKLLSLPDALSHTKLDRTSLMLQWMIAFSFLLNGEERKQVLSDESIYGRRLTR